MKSILFYCAFILLVSLACFVPGIITPAPIPTFDVNQIPTMVVQTAQALALSATATSTNIPTSTSAAILLPLPTGTPALTSIFTQTDCPETNSLFEMRVIELINAERAKAELPALTYQNQLAATAQLHSMDMACSNYFNHTAQDNSGPADRAGRQGYASNFIGENIAAGYSTPQEVVNGWMNSPDHKANILGSDYIEIGVGYAYSKNSAYGAYWTAVFGSP